MQNCAARRRGEDGVREHGEPNATTPASVFDPTSPNGWCKLRWLGAEGEECEHGEPTATTPASVFTSALFFDEIGAVAAQLLNRLNNVRQRRVLMLLKPLANSGFQTATQFFECRLHRGLR